MNVQYGPRGRIRARGLYTDRATTDHAGAR